MTASTITDQDPISPDVTAGEPYQGWVVTFPNVPVVSYGPKKISGSCPLIAIMDSATGHWTEFFQTCQTGS